MGLALSSLNWGFSPQDLLSNAMTLVGGLGQFILLGVAVAFAPLLIRLIRNAIVGDEEEEEEDAGTDRWGFPKDEFIGEEWDMVGRGWYNSETGEYRPPQW